MWFIVLRELVPKAASLELSVEHGFVFSEQDGGDLAPGYSHAQLISPSVFLCAVD